MKLGIKSLRNTYLAGHPTKRALCLTTVVFYVLDLQHITRRYSFTVALIQLHYALLCGTCSVLEHNNCSIALLTKNSPSLGNRNGTRALACTYRGPCGTCKPEPAESCEMSWAQTHYSTRNENPNAQVPVRAQTMTWQASHLFVHDRQLV